MSLGVRIRYWLLTGCCTVVGWLPTWFLYHPLLDFIYFILYKVTKYRLPIVRANLKDSFPEKQESELRDIERKFYRHLAEIIIDTIDLTGISAKELRSRMVFSGIEKIETQMEGRDWIAASAHYGSWEYFGIYQTYTKYQILGAYHPLSDDAFDRFYRHSRSRFGMEPVSVKLLLRRYLNNRKEGKRQIIGLISDQIPTLYNIDHWYWFLGQHTAFYYGMETMAVRFGLPIVFVHVDKISRAHYKSSFEVVYDGTEQVEEHEIIERYVVKLEEMIRQRPELWMWSHRRWKHKPAIGREYNVKL